MTQAQLDHALNLAETDDQTGFWCDSRERKYQILRSAVAHFALENTKLRTALEAANVNAGVVLSRLLELRADMNV